MRHERMLDAHRMRNLNSMHTVRGYNAEYALALAFLLYTVQRSEAKGDSNTRTHWARSRRQARKASRSWESTWSAVIVRFHAGRRGMRSR